MTEMPRNGNIRRSWQIRFFKVFTQTSAANHCLISRVYCQNMFALVTLFIPHVGAHGKITGSNAAGTLTLFPAGKQNRRDEERVLTCNCITLDQSACIFHHFSTTFGEVDWKVSWSAYEHLFWILQGMYYGQASVVREQGPDSVDSYSRCCTSRMCTQSTFMEFGAGDSLALMAFENGSCWLSPDDGVRSLLELRFADDVLIFCTRLDKECLLLDELIASLA